MFGFGTVRKALGSFGTGLRHFGSFASRAAKHAGTFGAPAAQLAGMALDKAGYHKAAKVAGHIGRGAAIAGDVADALTGLGGGRRGGGGG